MHALMKTDCSVRKFALIIIKTQQTESNTFTESDYANNY